MQRLAKTCGGLTDRLPARPTLRAMTPGRHASAGRMA